MTTKRNDSTHSTGRFCWHELMTTDVNAARAFYGELFGWTFREMEMGPAGTYTIAKAGDKDVAGLMKPDAKSGAPTHWVGYATSPDVDACAERARKLGGQVHVPPTDIPNVGRFAITSDPQGATLGILRLLEDADDDAPPSLGRFCWDELHTRDPKKAFGYYAELFGWSAKEMDMGPAGTYRVLSRGNGSAAKDAGGIVQSDDANKPVMWLPYVAVDDVDAGTTRAKKLGAKLLMDAADIPGIGRFSVIADPSGAVLALYTAARK